MRNRVLKFIISLLVYYYDSILNGINFLFLKKTKSKVVVIYYHSIADDERLAFKKQIDIIKKESIPISPYLHGLIGKKKNYVLITFDDGFENIVRNAIPYLIEHRIPAVIFIPSNYIDKPATWMMEEGYDDYMKQIMSVKMIKDLPKELITIGSHSANHAKLTELKNEQIDLEFKDSKLRLESIIKSEVRLLSFPYGAYSRDLVNKAFKSGYSSVFTSEPHIFRVDSNEKVIGRIGVSPVESIIEFKLKIRGCYRWLPMAINLKSKIIRK